MRTSHKLTRLLLALTTLVVFSALALGQVPLNVGVSDQKAGSVLVYPYYISSVSGQTKSDTRISITNTSSYPYQTTQQQINNLARVHLFLVSGRDCTQADLFVCLTPNATASFKASEYDPDNSGYVIAVAVNAAGQPVINNVLIGNAFVNDSTGVTGHVVEGNYGAEAFRRVPGTAAGSREIGEDLAAAALLTGQAAQDAVAAAGSPRTNAQINWGNNGYDPVPNQFAVEVQHPADVQGQRIVVAGLIGNLSTGALGGCTQTGTGQAYNQDEKFGSFQSFLSSTCLCRSVISATAPRVPGGLGALFGPAGQGRSGTLKFGVGGGVGLLLTPKSVGGVNNPWSGIRTLHKVGTRTIDTVAGETGLIIPIFIPVC